MSSDEYGDFDTWDSGDHFDQSEHSDTFDHTEGYETYEELGDLRDVEDTNDIEDAETIEADELNEDSVDLSGSNESDNFELTMPTDNFGNEFAYRGSGINSEENHWCSRDFGPSAPNSNPYHYSNQDGSYYYSNPDGSTYYNNGKGEAWYDPPAPTTDTSSKSNTK